MYMYNIFCIQFMYSSSSPSKCKTITFYSSLTGLNETGELQKQKDTDNIKSTEFCGCSCRYACTCITFTRRIVTKEMLTKSQMPSLYASNSAELLSLRAVTYGNSSLASVNVTRTLYEIASPEVEKNTAVLKDVAE